MFCLRLWTTGPSRTTNVNRWLRYFWTSNGVYELMYAEEGRWCFNQSALWCPVLQHDCRKRCGWMASCVLDGLHHHHSVAGVLAGNTADADSDGNWNSSQDPTTNPNKRQRQPALLGDHPPEYGGPQSGYGHYDETYGPPPPHYEGRRMGPPLGRTRGGPRYGGPQYGHGPPPDYAAQADSPVIMVYGLDPFKINADRIFNIFCLYGNVERVKFMKSKPGAAMVEMGDCYAVERAISHLNHTMLFGQKLNICVSKQQAIIPGQSYQLEDGSTSFKDFHGSRNNRFSTPEQAAKNRIQRPSNVLHFFNGQPDSSTEIFAQISEELAIKPPNSVKLFTGKNCVAVGERSASGLLEWETINDAMEALSVMNHHQMKNPTGPYPFTLKLCFSTAQNAN